MNERQMNEALLAAFPELDKKLKKYASWQDGMNTGAFLTYEDVFRPHIEAAIEKNDAIFLERAGDFIEELFLTGDEYATSVICIGILEGLKTNCDNEAVRKFLRPATQGIRRRKRRAHYLHAMPDDSATRTQRVPSTS